MSDRAVEILEAANLQPRARFVIKWMDTAEAFRDAAEQVACRLEDEDEQG